MTWQYKVEEDLVGTSATYTILHPVKSFRLGGSLAHVYLVS